jgi:hypothetical protein
MKGQDAFEPYLLGAFGHGRFPPRLLPDVVAGREEMAGVDAYAEALRPRRAMDQGAELAEPPT